MHLVNLCRFFSSVASFFYLFRNILIVVHGLNNPILLFLDGYGRRYLCLFVFLFGLLLFLLIGLELVFQFFIIDLLLFLLFFAYKVIFKLLLEFWVDYHLTYPLLVVDDFFSIADSEHSCAP